VGRFLTITYQWARRCAIALIGGTVVLIGVAMIVLPGPAFIVIPAGLAILGIEFACARRWLRSLRDGSATMVDRTRLWFRRAKPARNEELVAQRIRRQ
jgi:tellurite resistance protein TerC